MPNRNAVTQDNNPLLFSTQKMLMKNSNDRIVSASLYNMKWEQIHCFQFSTRQMRIITKKVHNGSLWIPSSPGQPEILFKVHKIILHTHLKENREKLHVRLSNICSAIREFLTYIQHTGRPCPQGHSYCNQLKLNPVLHCKLRKQPGYFAR